MSDTNDDSVEAPKKGKTPAQMENVKKARTKKAENDEARLAEKERLKAEARFDKLLELFDKVRVESPEPPKPKPKPKPKDDDDDDLGGVQRQKVKVRAETPRTISLRFL
jgi:hypothetical protein